MAKRLLIAYPGIKKNVQATAAKAALQLDLNIYYLPNPNAQTHFYFQCEDMLGNSLWSGSGQDGYLFFTPPSFTGRFPFGPGKIPQVGDFFVVKLYLAEWDNHGYQFGLRHVAITHVD